MKFLAIETSCDETALSVIESGGENNMRVCADLVISQIDIHSEYGGVFPALAKREHAKNLVPLLEQVLKECGEYREGKHDYDDAVVKEILEREPMLYEALVELLNGIDIPNIDAIIVTVGPGLAPALWVGVNFARVLSYVWNIPLIEANHMEGHITSVLVKEEYRTQDEALIPLDQYSFPLLALLISGGHTQLVLVKGWGDYEIIGETIDDAVGEAFDKVARMLDLPYPGGPKISLLAQKGMVDERVSLPRPMLHSGDFSFSFSGLKTAVRYLIDDLKKEEILDEQMKTNIAREFEHAVAEVLVKKTHDALVRYGAHELIIAGGVSANTFIIESFKKHLEDNFEGVELLLPPRGLSGDNSLMIAVAGYLHYLRDNKNAFTPLSEVKALGNFRL